jgi:endonuclease-3
MATRRQQTATTDPARRLPAILAGLRADYPDPQCALDHASPFQLLAATILSAQCTDERVNQVTPALFARFPTPEAMATAEPEELEALVRSTGFFRNKARNLLGAAQAIVARHEGEVPKTMAELLELPGVARKTANVVLGTAFGIADGIVVDTHVRRLSQRLGLTRENDPVKIERDLMATVPRADWVWFSHALIWHGRKVCSARKPACERCRLAPSCPSAGLHVE